MKSRHPSFVRLLTLAAAFFTLKEIKLTASADGLKSATVSVQTQPCTPRPSVP